MEALGILLEVPPCRGPRGLGGTRGDGGADSQGLL